MSRSPLAQTAHRNNWRTATKSQILGNFSGQTNSSSTIDGSQAHHVRIVVDGMQEKYEQIVSDLKSDLEDNKMQQENCLAAGLMKLSKNIRNMSVRDFNRQYKCNLLALLKSKDGVVVSGQSGKPPVMDANKKRCYETPAPSMRRPPQMNTILRTARRGEDLYSQNGSPVAATEPGTVIATVCKKRRGNESANIEINIGDGQYISLDDPTSVSGLDARTKQAAKSNLKILQDQMASLMAQLQ